MTVPELRPMTDVAAELGIAPEHVIGWGPHRAKVDLAALEGREPTGRLILVSAITPTPSGEGKTTMAIALAMGMRARGRHAVLALREPSLGPVFGMKGGGTGGGAATIEPAEAINLHFTGDLHAITSAHNLLSALVDNCLQFGQQAPLDPRRVTWPRAVDMNDRFLRHVVLGLGGPLDGIPRESGFQITASSEVMAALCLASDLADLQTRLGRIVVGWTSQDLPVTADDIGAAPAMTALLRDALMPNLAQTADGGPVLVHGGPFANIAHGTNSMIATRMALATGADVITEGGFGFDLGGEKFLDIACRSAGIWPRAVVLVATLKALRLHGGAALAEVGKPNLAALRAGLPQLERHLFSVGAYGLPPVVALNLFPDDPADEVALLTAWCASRGVPDGPLHGFRRRCRRVGRPRRCRREGGRRDRCGPAATVAPVRAGRCPTWTRSLPWPSTSTAPTASRSPPPRSRSWPGSPPPWAPTCPSASPRHTCHCPMTPPGAACRTASRSPCARPGSPPAPGSWSPAPARSSRCPACPASPQRCACTSAPTARSPD